MTDKSRRDAIKTIGTVVGGAAVILTLPEQWVKPVVDSVVTPAKSAVLSVPPWYTTTSTTTGS